MDVKLKRQWKNHPPGTILKNVSPGIRIELAKAKVSEVAEKKSKAKVMFNPPADKMMPSPITETKERAVEKPPLPRVKGK